MQVELLAGKAVSSAISWKEFRGVIEDTRFSGISEAYAGNIAATFNAIEKFQRPDRLNRINAAWIEKFRSLMLKHRAATTVKKYLQHLKTSLVWAVSQHYLASMPAFPISKRTEGKSQRHMKGRPLTGEEYERIRSKCNRDGIELLLDGLWLSGLRIGEALLLTYDQWADGIRVQFDGDDVFLLFDAEDQKNREAQLYPVTDDFAAFLREHKREGHVFNVKGKQGRVCRRRDTMSKWVVEVGELANVKVDEIDGEPVWASAHDFRRAFGSRWSQIVPPMVLRDLMRHKSVTTTEKYYVGINAKRTLTALRQHTAALTEKVER